jgi:hypothetical protein
VQYNLRVQLDVDIHFQFACSLVKIAGGTPLFAKSNKEYYSIDFSHPKNSDVNSEYSTINSAAVDETE